MKYPKRQYEKDITKAEIKAYFGLLYLFGLVSKNSYTKHWSKNPLLYNPLP